MSQHPNASDAELVQCCLRGDETAWQALIERYQRLVISVSLRAGLDPDDADDVFQVVFTTLYRRLDGLRDQTKLASWLITTAQREAWRVGRGKRGWAELDEQTVDERPAASEVIEAAERDQRVREAMALLDDRCHALLTALFLESGSVNYAEVAAKLGMAVGSIGPTRARCFKKLETLLREAGLA